MAQLPDFVVTVQIEPVVKLTCYDTTCRFNLVHESHDWLACNLKRIVIDSSGTCQQRLAQRGEVLRAIP